MTKLLTNFYYFYFKYILYDPLKMLNPIETYKIKAINSNKCDSKSVLIYKNNSKNLLN